ncbi:MAG TPA: hypothetical protein VM899_10250 [Rubellimicrobium sp.]|jgi:predicted small lipoprotein YifL|nr:hypothetical protein [Rubellimicrobium sp.]
MRIVALLGLLALAACGADGPPLRPNGSVGAGASDGVASVAVASNGSLSLGIGP